MAGCRREQALAVVRIGPGPGHHARAVLRADVVHVEVDRPRRWRRSRRGPSRPQRLQGAGAQLCLARGRGDVAVLGVVVTVVVVMSWPCSDMVRLQVASHRSSVDDVRARHRQPHSSLAVECDGVHRFGSRRCEPTSGTPSRPWTRSDRATGAAQGIAGGAYGRPGARAARVRARRRRTGRSAAGARADGLAAPAAAARRGRGRTVRGIASPPPSSIAPSRRPPRACRARLGPSACSASYSQRS